jgi:hypothetical protein
LAQLLLNLNKYLQLPDERKMKKFAFVVTATICLLNSTASLAALISPIEYNLTGLTGNFAYGRTDYNAYGESATFNLDNVSSLSTVETLLSDGYVPMGYIPGQKNGIYSGYPSTGFHSIEFAFNNGTDYLLNSFSFLSSRAYTSSTNIQLEYALNGQPWQIASSTTSGALGITTGNANSYTLDFGGILADSFRLTLNSGGQVSFHEVSIDGSKATAVPEPATLALFGLGLLGFVAGRRKAKT